MKRRPLAWLGQLIAYGAFAAFVGYFAAAPAWQAADANRAQIKLSFTHAGAPARVWMRDHWNQSPGESRTVRGEPAAAPVSAS